MDTPTKRKISPKALAQLRRAKTTSCSKYGIGGLLKQSHAPKPINLRLSPEKR